VTRESSEERSQYIREDLRDRARADPHLTPKERETTIGVARDEDLARIHTEEAAIIRRLLAHEATQPTTVGLYDGETARRVSYDKVGAEISSEDEVVSLRARLPVRYVLIKGKGRNTDSHAEMVSPGVLDP
jgi:hypothetical protein